MGKRRSVTNDFHLPFCNHEKSVTVKLDRKAGVGQLDCRVCGQKFQCAVNYLSAAVDVYGEWVDAADAVAKEDTGDASYQDMARMPASSKRYPSGRASAGEDDDERRHQGDAVAADDEEY